MMYHLPVNHITDRNTPYKNPIFVKKFIVFFSIFYTYTLLDENYYKLRYDYVI